MQPCLWFDGQAEQAAAYYQSVFPRSAVRSVNRRPNTDGSLGDVLTVEFEVCGQAFLALNGGPEFKFTPAISLMVHCDTQEEADALFDRLAAEGQTMACGWVTDRYGVSWQIVPPGLLDLLFSADTRRSARAIAEMENQIRLDVRAVRAAYDTGQGG